MPYVRPLRQSMGATEPSLLDRLSAGLQSMFSGGAGATGAAQGVTSGVVPSASSVPRPTGAVKPLSTIANNLPSLITYSQAGFHAALAQRKFVSANLYQGAYKYGTGPSPGAATMYALLVSADAKNKSETPAASSLPPAPQAPPISQSQGQGYIYQGAEPGAQPQPPAPPPAAGGGSTFMAGITPAMLIGIGGGLIVLLMLTAPKKPPASPSPM